MRNNNTKRGQSFNQKIKALYSWSGLLKALFRLMISAGLFLLILFIILFLLTPLLTVWSFAFPLSVIAFGVIFARIEYALHKRLTRLQKEGTKRGDTEKDENASETCDDP